MSNERKEIENEYPSDYNSIEKFLDNWCQLQSDGYEVDTSEYSKIYKALLEHDKEESINYDGGVLFGKEEQRWAYLADRFAYEVQKSGNNNYLDDAHIESLCTKLKRFIDHYDETETDIKGKDDEVIGWISDTEVDLIILNEMKEIIENVLNDQKLSYQFEMNEIEMNNRDKNILEMVDSIKDITSFVDSDGRLRIDEINKKHNINEDYLFSYSESVCIPMFDKYMEFQKGKSSDLSIVIDEDVFKQGLDFKKLLSTNKKLDLILKLSLTTQVK